MKPLVSIIMGSTSDLPVMEKAMKQLEELQIPFEVNALSAHRTPEAVETIGVPIKGMLDGLDALLSIVQMPPGIPVATVGVNGAANAAVLAAQMIAIGDEEVAARVADQKRRLGEKIEKANEELAEIKFQFKTN